jgi:hypothetical protein
MALAFGRVGCVIAALGGGALQTATPFSRAAALPDSSRRAYRVDAERIALQLLRSSSVSFEAELVTPPLELIDSIHSSLLAVVLLDHPAVDSVVHLFKLHASFDFGDPNSILIALDSTASWVSEWDAGRPATRVPIVDSILAPLAIMVAREDFFRPAFRWYRVHSSLPIDHAALQRKLVGIPGIQDVIFYPVFRIGGRHLTGERTLHGWRFVFSLSWGDCPSGCYARRYWPFQVNSTGHVAYLGSHGDTVPPDWRSR